MTNVSHPTRVRGLKSRSLSAAKDRRTVAPHAGAIKRYNNNINTKKPRSYKVNDLFYVVFIFIKYRFNANYFDYFRIYASQNASQNSPVQSHAFLSGRNFMNLMWRFPTTSTSCFTSHTMSGLIQTAEMFFGSANSDDL